MKNIGLVLQGGGMRGVYTAGVLDCFMDKGLYFPYVAAVSAGACNGSAYLARQKGFGKHMNTEYLDDPRFISWRNWLKEGSIYGLNFMLHEAPLRFSPDIHTRFYQAREKFVVSATDCVTGESVYFDKDDCDDMMTAIKASSSLPFVSRMVQHQGMYLLDGGIADPIPINKSIQDGNQKHVVILTSEPVPTPKPSDRLWWLARTVYPRHKRLVEALFDHHQVFNDTLDHIAQLEQTGQAFVIKPGKYIPTKNIERDKSKLLALYDQGYLDAMNSYEKLCAWLGMAVDGKKRLPPLSGQESDERCIMR